MECASVRFASRCGGAQSIRPHRCVTFEQRYTTMRLNRPIAAATACKSRARALHVRTRKLARA
eukprot:6713233-Lingulodinium_polyedra.AAC.1